VRVKDWWSFILRPGERDALVAGREHDLTLDAAEV
jgi:hypothetical protein